MRCATRFFAALAAVAVVGYASVASATQFFVPAPPPDSDMTIDVDLGSVGSTVGSLGPLAVTGTADADVSVSAEGAGPWLPGAGDGSLTFNFANLLLADEATTLDLGILGTIDIALAGVGLSITSDAIPVVGNEWNIDTIGAPTVLDIALNQGTITLDNPTGLVATFIPPEDLPLVFDLNTDPLGVTLADLLGTGIGGTADSSTISIDIPQIANLITDDPLNIYAVLSGGIFLQVPEPTTYAMLGMGLIGLVAAGRRRFRKA